MRKQMHSAYLKLVCGFSSAIKLNSDIFSNEKLGSNLKNTNNELDSDRLIIKKNRTLNNTRSSTIYISVKNKSS